MAKKVYDEKIDINVNWGGDESTGGLPVSGNRVQEVVKETLNSKVGFVGMVESTGMYVMTKDETTYQEYLNTITTDNPSGNQDLIIGEFRAPFEYSASVEILTPADGYAVVLEGTTGNILKFRPSTKDASGAPLSEAYSYTITFRNGGTVQTYNGRVSKDTDVELNIDKYLSKGINSISVMVTGQDTGVSAFKSAEIRILEISLVDSFKISNVYNLKDNNSQLTVNYKVKSTGPSVIKWYIDGNLVDETKGSNFNTENGVKNIMLQRGNYTQGVHTLRFYMECEDTTSNDIFRTDIFHRDFFITTGEDQTEAMIAMSFNIPYDESVIVDNKAPNVYDAIQYENVDLTFSTYYQGKATTSVNIIVLKPNTFEYVVDGSYLTKNGDIYTHELNLQDEGSTTVKLVADNAEYVVGPFFVEKSDMNIEPIENNVMLYFNAQGRSNSSADKDVWSYTDSEGNTYDVKFNNFAWSPTNGWNNDKLVIARGSSIDIDFKPFADPSRLAAGCTFEFEFNTSNVYDDDAVICNLCDDSGAPGIIITATEAKFMITKGASGPESDTAASTKFKSGENNRISFVITPRGEQDNRGRFVKVYVNGVICGAVVYDYNANLTNNKSLHFEATEGAEIELGSIRFYSSALSNDEILDNYIFYRNDIDERIELYKKNNIYDESNIIDIDVIKQQIPVMLFKQRLKDDGSGETEGKIEDIETEYVDKKKTIYLDVEYEDVQNPTFNFRVERARIRPQGTSSMKYPKKNFRIYTRKKDDAGNYESKLFDYEGNEVSKRRYSFKTGAAPVDCWCLKADFAESSGTHNTGTARFWNNVLKEAGILTQAQAKAQKINYEYDVRTTIDGFPIVLFYQEIGSTPRFIGKYNFNNDKSTEDVFGFTGGPEVDDQEVMYFPIGKIAPVINDGDPVGAYTDNPTTKSSLYAKDDDGNYYMLRGKELFDNPRMECWEMLDSGSLIGLFKTVEGFAVEREDKETVGRYYTKQNEDGTTSEVWEEAFESRYPDCGEYFHVNNLKAFCEWMVSCIYLKIDANGKAVNMTDEEIVELSGEDTLTIHSITQREGFEDYFTPQTLPNTAENRKEKFRVEKYDHFDMEKMAAYYIYLMRFGGVDQVVKNAMFTTEGSDDNEGHPEWPSKWYYINYDNDTILGVKNNGHLVFDPYITRETKEAGTESFAYAGRESTMWNNLEDDAEFVLLVSQVDEKLHTLNGLSYNNAIDMYNNKQAGQWCERVYNMDAQYKYIDSYVSPTVSDTSSEADLDYLFDVQGPRSAHRKWWLSKRFNIFDSKFVTGDFLKSDIVMKVNNPATDCNIILTSGEDIYYAIGGNDSVYYITPEAVLSGDDCALPVFKGTQIGTPISVYGGPNIEKIDLRQISDVLGQLEMANAYNANLGTKLKKLYIGDKDNPIINSFGDWTTSGFGNLEKCEEMDFTGMSSQSSLNDLNKLKNLKKLYAAGTNMIAMSFAEGGMIEEVEAPVGIQTLVFSQLPNMTFDGLSIYKLFKETDGTVTKTLNETYGDLSSLTIHECPKMMDDPTFIFGWLARKKAEGKMLSSFTLDMDGVDWTLSDINSLKILAEVGTGIGKLNMAGNIHINKMLSLDEVQTLQSIFGKNCFESDAQLRITALSAVYIVGDNTITEGDGVHKYDFIRVNLDTEGTFTVSLKDNMGSIPDEEYVNYVNNETGCTIEVLENNSTTVQLVLSLQYKYGVEVANAQQVINIVNRVYPEKVVFNGTTDIAETQEYAYELSFESSLGDVNGIMEYEWILTGEATALNGSRPYLEIKSTDNNKCVLMLNSYFDGFARLGVNIKRKYDGVQIFNSNTTYIDLFLADPSTLLTPNRNPEVYNIFLNAGLVPEGREKITKGDAMLMTESDLMPNGVSLFKGHTEIKSFDEFQWWTGLLNIGNDMFNGCSGMTSITLPTGVITIGNSAFMNCSQLKGIKSNSVINIGNNAFNGCRAMTQAVFSDMLETIGTTSFNYCQSLDDFHVSSSLKSLGDRAFGDCPNISFNGGNDVYYVNNNNLYYVNGNVTSLVHMGKESLMSGLLDDREIIALGYSMEYRTEKDVVVPENVIFNGNYVFNGSKGDSITLSRTISEMSCQSLFSKTDYKKYNFADGETTIPDSCFNGNTFTSFIVPEGIKYIKSQAFYGCTNMTSITFPSTLESFGTNVLWLCTNLTKIYFKGATPPSIYPNDMFNVLLDSIYVYPEYVDVWRTNFEKVFAPFVSPWYLYNEGYVRIIQDGQIMFYGNENETVENVIIGGKLKPIQLSDGYLKYNANDEVINDFSISIDGTVIGNVFKQYTTLYLGDNTSLFTGNGANFTKGLFSGMMASVMPNGNPDNWYYDVKFEGLRSKKIEQDQKTSLKFDIDGYDNTELPMEYTYLNHNGSYTTIYDSNNNEILSMKFIDDKTSTDYTAVNGNISFTTSDGIFTVTHTRTGIIHSGIDGIIIHKLGNMVYSDPEIQTMALSIDEEPKHYILNVSLNADIEIPNDVVIRVSDNKSVEYNKLWNGDKVSFILPIGKEYEVSVSSFITEKGKLYNAPVKQMVNSSDDISFTYITETGISVDGNVLYYKTSDADYMVYLNKYQSAWGETGMDLSGISNDDIFSVETDGLYNTEYILSQKADNEMFSLAYNHNAFDENVKGYIPSFIEISILNENIKEINNVLASKGKKTLDFSNCWTSDAYDNENAWDADGNISNIENVKYFYVFGRRIML